MRGRGTRKPPWLSWNSQDTNTRMMTSGTVIILQGMMVTIMDEEEEEEQEEVEEQEGVTRAMPSS